MFQFIYLVITSSLPVAILNEGERENRQLGRLQGEWSLVETADENRTDRGNDRIRMVIRGNEVTLGFGGLPTNQGTLEIGHLQQVGTIDLKFADGKSFKGVYELNAALLTICFDTSERGRPPSLLPRGTQWLEKWRRVNPGSSVPIN
jgi:uncharacterized protein (TIGR03067 family)